MAANLLEAVAWAAAPRFSSLSGVEIIMLFAGFVEAIATVVYFAEVKRRVPADTIEVFYSFVVPITDLAAIIGTLAAPTLALHLGVDTVGIIVGCLIALPIVAFATKFV